MLMKMAFNKNVLSFLEDFALTGEAGPGPSWKVFF